MALGVGDRLICKKEYHRQNVIRVGDVAYITQIKQHNPHITKGDYCIIVNCNGYKYSFYSFTWDGFSEYIWNYFDNRKYERKMKLTKIYDNM